MAILYAVSPVHLEGLRGWENMVELVLEPGSV